MGEDKKVKKGKKGKSRKRKKQDKGNLGRMLKNIHSKIDISDVKSNQDKSLLKTKQRRLAKLHKIKVIFF